MKDFDKLVTEHQSVLFGTCRRFCRNHADAQDLLQRSLLSLWERFDTYDTEKSFLAWSRATIRYSYYEGLRQQAVVMKGHEQVSSDVLDWLPSGTKGPCENVQILLDTLEEPDAELIRSVCLDDDEIGLTAYRTEIEEKNIPTRLKQAKARLRRRYDEFFG